MDEIIELLERREQKGLALLQDRYAPYCYSIIYQLLRDHEQTEEALSDVWLQAWNTIPQAKPENLRPYLAKAARNTAIHYLQYNSAQKRSGMTVLLDELEECIPDPQWECDRDWLKELLHRFVGSLNPEERQLFLRRYWYGDTVEELAVAMSSSRTRITGILFRIRKRLKIYLKTEGYEL